MSEITKTRRSETIRNRLAGHKGATAAHREAHNAVDAAIREIDSALKVR